MVKLTPLLCGLFIGCATVAAAQDLPPDAQPGKCYALCLIPDQYETVTEVVRVRQEGKRSIAVPPLFEEKNVDIVLRPESKRLVYIPAVYDTIEERIPIKWALKEAAAGQTPQLETVKQSVMIRPPGKRFVAIPAEYDTVMETITVEPAYTDFKVMQPRYKTVQEQIEVQPAGVKWVRRQADANCLSADPNDCYVLCMVEVPAQYQTVSKRINMGCNDSGVSDAGCIVKTEVSAKTTSAKVLKVKKAATVREEAIPAEYVQVDGTKPKLAAGSTAELQATEFRIVRKFVEKTPARYEEVVIPAETKSVKVKTLKTAGGIRLEEYTEEPFKINSRKLIKAGGLSEWREVLCGEKVTGYTVRQIQAALRAAGYDPGPPDNVMGGKTKEALVKFQKDKGLPQGNLDMETLKALGIGF